MTDGVRLQRPVVGRLVGPDLLQLLAVVHAGSGLLGLVVVFPLLEDAGTAAYPILFGSVFTVLFAVLGVTGGALVTSTGLAWRLRVPVHVAWSDVREVELGQSRGGRYRATSGTSAVLQIRVQGAAVPRWLPGNSHVIAPAVARGAGRVDVEFARSVVERARADGVPVVVTSVEWQHILADSGVVLAHREVDLGRERGPSRVGLRVLGASLALVGGVALYTAIVGVEPGTAGRIASGVLGFPLFLLGVILLRIQPPTGYRRRPTGL